MPIGISNGEAAARAQALIERRLSATFAHAGVGLCELDTEGRFLRVNQTLCNLLGRSEQSLRDLSVADVTHPDDLPQTLRLIRGIQQDGEPRSLDKRYCRQDGSVVWARSTVTRLPDVPGDPANLLVVTVDLSDRRRAEQALLASEQRARTLIEGIADATWEMQRDGLVREDAADWGAMTGQTPEEWQDAGWIDAIHPDDRGRARVQWDLSVANLARFDIEVRVQTAAGDYRWTNLRAGPVFEHDGPLLKWVCMCIDISARKCAEAARYESEVRLQNLVDGIPQMVWRALEDGRWTWSSNQWHAVTGQSVSESLGFGWLDAVHPEDRAHTLACWSEAMRDGAFKVEHRLRSDEVGRYCWFQTRAAPVRVADGSIVEWLGTSTDVDDLRRLQEQQRMLVEELQHRTRNLLGLVSVIAGRTLENSGDFDDFRTRFNVRLDALARVQTALSRLDDSEPVTLDRLIADELAAHGVSPGASNVEMAGPTDLGLQQHSIQPLALTLHELATNAVKHGALGSGRGQLSIRWGLRDLNGPGHRLRLEWHETGVEMPKAGNASRKGGQGRELIDRVLPYQLQAETSFQLTGDGIACVIELPAARVLAG